MFERFNNWLRPQIIEEQQIKWEIQSDFKTTNEKIVAVCKNPALDTREIVKTREWSAAALAKLREDMLDPWGNVIVYRGNPPYRIKE